ncbi:hypothetical protein CCR75_006939 [Bremia lactucae]|uniref:Uncharacterized protein n=1 Tax=Bremia lactucae TaxID=4779 RepID=A0A976NZL3_BRELC|nr:hypothetical protein CCR75_006939 [Bremia lactucae]
MIREVWRIELGLGVGPFRLGASIAEVLHVLKSRLPVRPFEIVYDVSEPYKRDVVVKSDQDGLKLLFDPLRQMLKCIDFYDVNRVALKFGRVIIFGGDISATFMSVYNLFGPTFPGHYNAAVESYVLAYDGGCIRFSIPVKYRDLYEDCTNLPMEFPNGATSAATGLAVFVGEDYRSPESPPPVEKHYFEEVGVEIDGNITSLAFAGRKQCIRLGWSPQVLQNSFVCDYDFDVEFRALQEIISKLGAPVSVFRRFEDPNYGSLKSFEYFTSVVLLIHICSATIAGGIEAEYFHNYPHLGLDILYNVMHRASKVILKTNALGHPDFGAYNKCNFLLKFPLSAPQESKLSQRSIIKVTPHISWKEICLTFEKATDLRPVVHDNGLGLHPFGSTLCYPLTPGCTFEVMKNGFIASVTLSIRN